MLTKQGNNRHNIHLKFTSAARLYRSTPRLTCLNFKLFGCTSRGDSPGARGRNWISRFSKADEV